ncbi:YheC/YheD family protein [Alteribacter keqinensis]|nr:YheC/YheD family protein [Alteribacter keqinensis]
MSFMADQTLIRLRFINELTNTITVPDRFAREYGLIPGDDVTVRFGSWQKKAGIKTDSESAPDTIGVSFSLFPFKGLLKADTPYYLKFPKRDTWQIGPLFAMLVNEGTEDLSAPFGAISTFARELAEYASSVCAAFVVIPLKQRLEDSDLQGFYLKGETWTFGEIPYPDVIYNRISTPKKESSKKGKLILGKAREKNIPFFNDRFIHKWEMHQILSDQETLRPYLPDTVLANDREGFFQFTKRYSQLYLKPVWGREGNGILRITCHDHSIEAEYPSDTAEKSVHFRSFDHFYSMLLPRFKEKGYLVQEAIPLLTINDCLIDIRVLTVKSESGLWGVASKIARCGVKDQIVSNVAKGGEQKKVIETLEGLFPELHTFHLIRFLNELAVETAFTIEEALGETGCYGEFGVDIGIDCNGHPWILEVNSKPSKSYDSPDQDKVRPSVKRLLSYCHYLSPFD